jgi:lysophospholipase L1-like esterase
LARRFKLSAAHLLAISLLPTVFLLLLGESGARAYYFFSNGYDYRYLAAPLGGVRVPVVYPAEPGQTHTRLDPCSRREITFTVNELGRGPNPMVAKPGNTARVIAVGASSTFGVNNPDEATWPAFLEDALRRRYGEAVEVLNAGKPGYQLEDFVYAFSKQLIQYQPDMVVFYEAWNDTHLPIPSQVHHQVRRFNEYTGIGRLASWLYARSLLYTYLLEKTQFLLVTRSKEGPVPRIGRFQTQLEGFIQLLRKHKVTPVLVLQVYDTPPEPSIRDLRLDDSEEVRALILKLANANARTTYDQLTKIRVYQAQVLVEVVRRTGAALGVQVIDPRPTFAQYRETAPLFCDVVHLTDRANQLLAQTIAEQLHLPARH